MADQEAIYEIIADHILNESEDEHLDFKLKWHSDFPPLLKDIIAMANSSDDKNSYIVFGVSDDFNIVGLTAEDQRYKKADIAAAIRDSHFAGNGVPEIDLHSVYIDGKQLDVLEIKKSNNVPYYITTPKKPISPFVIYTRANDTNREATFEESERLWKKRFNLLLPEKELFNRRITEPDNWEKYKDEYFYTYDASYRLKIGNETEEGTAPFYAYIVDDWGRFSSNNAVLSHNGNEIASFQIAYLDGFRLELVVPEHFSIKIEDNGKPIYIIYRGYIRDSLRMNLANFLYLKGLVESDIEYRVHFERLRDSFVIHESMEDKEIFESYIITNYTKIKQDLSKYNPIIYSEIPEKSKKDIKWGMFLHELHSKKDIWCQAPPK